jgi:hypothetical protein
MSANSAETAIGAPGPVSFRMTVAEDHKASDVGCEPMDSKSLADK